MAITGIETKGFVLLAFGKRQYGQMAYNLAMTIKALNPYIEIQVIADPKTIADVPHNFFNIVTEMAHEDIYEPKKTDNPFEKEVLNPAKAKSRIFKYLVYDHSIFLDVDAVCVKDPMTLINQCMTREEYFLVQQTIDFLADVWADTETARLHYKFEGGLPNMNGSFAYIEKQKAKKVYERFQKNVDKPLLKLKNQWGGTFPDELALNVAIAQLKLNADIGFCPVYISNKPQFAIDMLKDSYFMAIGGGISWTGERMLRHYDALVNKASMEMTGQYQLYKAHELVKHKHANHK